MTRVQVPGSLPVPLRCSLPSLRSRTHAIIASPLHEPRWRKGTRRADRADDGLCGARRRRWDSQRCRRGVAIARGSVTRGRARENSSDDGRGPERPGGRIPKCRCGGVWALWHWQSCALLFLVRCHPSHHWPLSPPSSSTSHLTSFENERGVVRDQLERRMLDPGSRCAHFVSQSTA